MADAEASAKRLIGHQLSSRNPIPALSEADSYSLAHWATLKVIVGLAHLKFTFVPRVQYEIRRGRIPEGVHIEICQASSLALNSLYGPIIVWKAREIDPSIVGALAAHSIIGCIQLGRVMFRVSFVPPHERIKRVRMTYRTALLYPYRAEVAYEHHQFLDSAVERLELPTFAVSLGLMDFPAPPQQGSAQAC